MCLIWISSQKKFNFNRIIIIFFNSTGVYVWVYILIFSNDKSFFFFISFWFRNSNDKAWFLFLLMFLYSNYYCFISSIFYCIELKNVKQPLEREREDTYAMFLRDIWENTKTEGYRRLKQNMKPKKNIYYNLLLKKKKKKKSKQSGKKKSKNTKWGQHVSDSSRENPC